MVVQNVGLSGSKSQAQDKIIIINNKKDSTSEKAVSTGKYIVNNPFTVYGALLAGSYVAAPLAPVAVVGAGIYGANKMLKNICLFDKDNKYESIKNISVGAATTGASLALANRALRIAKKSGLKEPLKDVGKNLPKLNFVKSFGKCIKVIPDSMGLAFSKFKKALVTLGVAKGFKKIFPGLIKVLKKLAI